jgi:hypothetical protein
MSQSGGIRSISFGIPELLIIAVVLGVAIAFLIAIVYLASAKRSSKK